MESLTIWPAQRQTIERTWSDSRSNVLNLFSPFKFVSAYLSDSQQTAGDRV